MNLWNVFRRSLSQAINPEPTYTIDDWLKAAHRREIDDLEDAIIRDDDNGTGGSGEVLWVSPEHPVYRVEEFLKGVKP